MKDKKCCEMCATFDDFSNFHGMFLDFFGAKQQKIVASYHSLIIPKRKGKTSGNSGIPNSPNNQNLRPDLVATTVKMLDF